MVLLKGSSELTESANQRMSPSTKIKPKKYKKKLPLEKIRLAHLVTEELDAFIQKEKIQRKLLCNKYYLERIKLQQKKINLKTDNFEKNLKNFEEKVINDRKNHLLEKRLKALKLEKNDNGLETQQQKNNKTTLIASNQNSTTNDLQLDLYVNQIEHLSTPASEEQSPSNENYEDLKTKKKVAAETIDLAKENFFKGEFYFNEVKEFKLQKNAENTQKKKKKLNLKWKIQ
ncbi:hypothetical protein HDU92_008914 [Lobulomyces angularis]|nr:hypothetical protein HDU92_008914 [Lobulomyces angularis]